MRRPALVLALGAVLGACAAPVAGTPSAAPTVRPREVRLEGVDTCSLLTPVQVKELGLEGPGRKDADPGRDGCYWGALAPRAVSTLVTAATDHGVQAYDTDPDHSDVAALVVHGFPALQLSFKGRSDNCAVGVDVAPGQVIDVQFSANLSSTPILIGDLCSGARRVADFAVGNLLAQR